SSCGAGIEPADPSFKATDFYQQKLPRNLRVPCGNRTRLSRVEAWHFCRSAKGTWCFFEAEAVKLERTTELMSAPAFEAGSSSGRMTSRSLIDSQMSCCRRRKPPVAELRWQES